MKGLKFIAAVTASILCFSFVQGTNPEKGKNDNLAGLVVEKLNKDVQLTDSQKIILKEKFKTFAVKVEDADKQSNEKVKFDIKKTASDEYEHALDSILNPKQKELMREKISQREKNE